MDGREFLPCAERLAASSSAADLRSAVSRAYYAAFHAALAFFRSCGIRFSKNSPAAHEKIPDCLDNSNIPDAVAVGRMLRSLRGSRNIADYDLESLVFEKEANVDLRIDAAKDIIKMIDDLDADRANVATILKAKARALGIHVT